jgi:hypothetical protein
MKACVMYDPSAARPLAPDTRTHASCWAARLLGKGLYVYMYVVSDSCGTSHLYKNAQDSYIAL